MIEIKTNKAPRAIGTYSQGVKVGDMVYFSGQIPMDPETMQLVVGDFASHVRQVFENTTAVANAADGDLSHIVKLTIYLTEMENWAVVNDVMSDYFQKPYPARSVVGVSALPKGAAVEMEAIMHFLSSTS